VFCGCALRRGCRAREYSALATWAKRLGDCHDALRPHGGRTPARARRSSRFASVVASLRPGFPQPFCRLTVNPVHMVFRTGLCASRTGANFDSSGSDVLQLVPETRSSAGFPVAKSSTAEAALRLGNHRSPPSMKFLRARWRTCDAAASCPRWVDLASTKYAIEHHSLQVRLADMKKWAGLARR
jgi:hypothetical protein